MRPGRAEAQIPEAFKLAFFDHPFRVDQGSLCCLGIAHQPLQCSFRNPDAHGNGLDHVLTTPVRIKNNNGPTIIGPQPVG